MATNHFVSVELYPTGGPPLLAAPDKRSRWRGAASRAALEDEKKVSGLIRDLAKTADAEGDLDSRQLIDRFLTEQIEEEDTVNEILDRLELVGDDGAGILRLDAELGQR